MKSGVLVDDTILDEFAPEETTPPKDTTPQHKTETPQTPKADFDSILADMQARLGKTIDERIQALLLKQAPAPEPPETTEPNIDIELSEDDPRDQLLKRLIEQNKKLEQRIKQFEPAAEHVRRAQQTDAQRTVEKIIRDTLSASVPDTDIDALSKEVQDEIYKTYTPESARLSQSAAVFTIQAVARGKALEHLTRQKESTVPAAPPPPPLAGGTPPSPAAPRREPTYDELFRLSKEQIKQYDEAESAKGR